MKDKQLRERFFALCRHLNVRWDPLTESYEHEGGSHDFPCKVMRKSDLRKAMHETWQDNLGVFERIAESLTHLSKRIDALEKKKRSKKK